MSENNKGDLVSGRWNCPIGIRREEIPPKVGEDWFIGNFLGPNEN